MSYIKKFAKGFVQLVIISCITFLLFEVAYRYGVIDFYKAEIKVLNPNNSIESTSVDYLVFGDSFSTPTGNYVDRLRSKHTEKSFLNLSIPGTGIKQVNTFAKKKINKSKLENVSGVQETEEPLSQEISLFEIYFLVSMATYPSLDSPETVARLS